ncbi:MAG: biotin--[acetyl-CoA-carboxylase] ligase [Phycisphaeraceae bacterium]|nr:biotin--[acetyl-CoA-carboxylase] ligase [Phycisphaeraceae bacterium]
MRESASPVFVHLDRVDSTNDEAKRRLASGEIGTRTVIVAREQVRGRGTQGRSWTSPRDAGLYLTLVDTGSNGNRPRRSHRAAPPPALLAPLITLAAGVAVAEALEETCGVTVSLKPVNDVYATTQDDRGARATGKLGGILTESTLRDGALRDIVVGIGINVRRAPRPVDAGAAPAIALEALGWHGTPLDLVDPVACALSRRLDRALEGDVGAILDPWNARRLAGTAALTERALHGNPTGT